MEKLKKNFFRGVIGIEMAALLLVIDHGYDIDAAQSLVACWHDELCMYYI